MQLATIYKVVGFKTNKAERVTVSGIGQEPITYLRKEYPKFTKFILEGFSINGKFVRAKI